MKRYMTIAEILGEIQAAGVEINRETLRVHITKNVFDDDKMLHAKLTLIAAPAARDVIKFYVDKYKNKAL